jgi:hypothetical protein
MAITLAASVNNGVYRVEDYEMAQEGGEYWKTKYFYSVLHDLDKEDGVIYACFDTFGNPSDKELFDKIELEFGIK